MGDIIRATDEIAKLGIWNSWKDEVFLFCGLIKEFKAKLLISEISFGILAADFIGDRLKYLLLFGFLNRGQEIIYGIADFRRHVNVIVYRMLHLVWGF